MIDIQLASKSSGSIPLRHAAGEQSDMQIDLDRGALIVVKLLRLRCGHRRVRDSPQAGRRRFSERVHEIKYLDTTPLAGSPPHAAEGAR